MIIAINKMDKPGSNAQKVREALLQYDVQVESMGGEVQDVEVSALTKVGLDDLVDKIQLQAELLELHRQPRSRRRRHRDRGEAGQGPRPGGDDPRRPRHACAWVISSSSAPRAARSGRSIDDKGKQVKSAGPSVPVEVLGLSGVPVGGRSIVGGGE